MRNTWLELLAHWREQLMAAAGVAYSGEALMAFIRLLGSKVNRHLLDGPLRQLSLYYLSLPCTVGEPLGPVATFHIGNGARLERIDPLSDRSEERMRTAYGTMVNCVYEPDVVEADHERFTSTGQITLSKTRERRRLDPLLDEPASRQ